jgi:hypothetical protein
MREREQRQRSGGFFPTLVLVWVILSFIVLRPGGRDMNAVVNAPPQAISLATPTPVTAPTSEPVALIPRPLAQVSYAVGEAGFTLCRRIRIVEAEGVILRNLPVADASNHVTVLSPGTELAVKGYQVSQPGIDDGWWLVDHPEWGEGYVTASHSCTQCTDANR